MSGLAATLLLFGAVFGGEIIAMVMVRSAVAQREREAQARRARRE